MNRYRFDHLEDDLTAVDAALLAIEGGTPVSPQHVRWPQITDADRAAVSSSLDTDNWGLHNPCIIELQERFADRCGAAHALALNSGTAALECALVAAGVGPGREVIVPAVSFGASALAVALLGARPVFCDVRADTYTLDPSQVERLLTNRTTALLPVALHGLFTDVEAFDCLADRHGLHVIWDVCQAAGARDGDHRAGSAGLASAFSLNSTKVLMAGEGGLITCDDDDVFDAISRYACFGEQRPLLRAGETRAYWSETLGDNYRMTNIVAALALSQLDRLDEHVARADDNARSLYAALAELPGFAPPMIPDGCLSTHWQPRVKLDPTAHGWTGSATEFRDRVIFALRAEGLAVGTWQLHPLPAHPVYRRDSLAFWTPGFREPGLNPWIGAAFPTATQLLSSSLTVAGHPYPLYVQPPSVVGRYIDGFRKVYDRMSVILTADYEPVREMPPIPEAQL
jgi:perosamine synthetase